MYDGTITIHDPGLVDTLSDLPEGYRGFVRHDPDPENPRTWDTIATIIGCNDRRGEIDKDEFGYIDTARDHWRWTESTSLVGGTRSDRAVKAVGRDKLLARYIAIFHPEIALYVDYWSAGRDLYGWGYVTKEAIERAEFAVDIDVQAVFDGEVATYQQWADGEVYGITVVHEESGKEASLWGVYDTPGYFAEVAAELIAEIEAE